MVVPGVARSAQPSTSGGSPSARSKREIWRRSMPGRPVSAASAADSSPWLSTRRPNRSVRRSTQERNTSSPASGRGSRTAMPRASVAASHATSTAQGSEAAPPGTSSTVSAGCRVVTSQDTNGSEEGTSLTAAGALLAPQELLEDGHLVRRIARRHGNLLVRRARARCHGAVQRRRREMSVMAKKNVTAAWSFGRRIVAGRRGRSRHVRRMLAAPYFGLGPGSSTRRARRRLTPRPAVDPAARRSEPDRRAAHRRGVARARTRPGASERRAARRPRRRARPHRRR